MKNREINDNVYIPLARIIVMAKSGGLKALVVK